MFHSMVCIEKNELYFRLNNIKKYRESDTTSGSVNLYNIQMYIMIA